MDFGFIKEEEAFCREIDQFTTKELGERRASCGWVPFGQPAVMAKNEQDIASSLALAKEFILE